MSAHADKTQENKSQSGADVVSQKRDSESAFQFFDNRPEAIAQRKLKEIANDSSQVKQLGTVQEMADTGSKENNTGLPDNLKSGIENLSGYSMDGVKVHYNSDKPTQLQAHAYTQGTNIYVASGQEKHLPHEAWHVVQQKQGRVNPTMQMKGVEINDNQGLEREADVMGAKAEQSSGEKRGLNLREAQTANDNPFQLKKVLNIGSGTNPANFIGAGTVTRDNGGGADTVVNVDSGHMLLAELMFSQPPKFFHAIEENEELDIKYAALEKKLKTADKEQIRQTDDFKAFIIRALFEKYPGKQGFNTMLGQLDEIEDEISPEFKRRIAVLEQDHNFKQGFAEDLSRVAPTYRYQAFDEVHVISALGFDLMNDEANLKQLANVLKTGSKLIITAEKTGMPGKALKMQKKHGKQWPEPVTRNDDGVTPVIKENLAVLYYFDYSEEESSIGTYEDVFEAHYDDISTSHTTGGGFDGAIPFVRLVFIFRGNLYDLDLARSDYEQAQGFEGYEDMSFSEFLSEYRQDI